MTSISTPAAVSTPSLVIDIGPPRWCWTQLISTSEGTLSYVMPHGPVNLTVPYAVKNQQIVVDLARFNPTAWHAAGHEAALVITGTTQDNLRWLVRATGQALRVLAGQGDAAVLPSPRDRPQLLFDAPADELVLTSVRVRGYYETLPTDDDVLHPKTTHDLPPAFPRPVSPGPVPTRPSDRGACTTRPRADLPGRSTRAPNPLSEHSPGGRNHMTTQQQPPLSGSTTAAWSVPGLHLNLLTHGSGRVLGRRISAFDPQSFARALSLGDIASVVACYAVDAEIRVVGVDHPPAAPLILTGRQRIASWLLASTSAHLDAEICHLVDGGDRIAFTQRWHFCDGTAVLLTSTAELDHALITTQHTILTQEPYTTKTGSTAHPPWPGPRPG